MESAAAIDEAIAALEAQRALLGDAVVDTALRPLRQQRAELEAGAATEQRKLVTVLFADLVDFTVLSQELDAEDVRTVVDAYFQRWQRVIDDHGGVVEKFIGDAVMAVFGLHRADEHDAHRAVGAALAMRAALDELNDAEDPGAGVAAAHGVTLTARVGIDTGDVVVSTLGDRRGQDFVVVGETVNRAARLQGVAPPGGIVASADTYRHVRGAFDVQPLAGLRLKGIEAPVDGYLVLGPRASGFGLDSGRGVEGVDTRTVGREIELRRLQEHFDEVVDERRWQVVTIVGEAGVGKTRLLTDFAAWLDGLAQPVWTFSARAAHEGPGRPYALLHDLFAARFAIHDSDPPDQVYDKWERGVARALGSGPRAAEAAHTIATWLGFQPGPVGDEPAADPRVVHDRATALLAEYFGRMSDTAPVVLLLEDLHWADEAMLDLVDLAGPALGRHPLLVVATARPTLLESRPHWGEGHDFHTVMPLEALSRRATRRLLAEILQRADTVPPGLSDLVVTVSEGNPFYVEELVTWLVDAGVIVRGEDVWRVRAERLAHVEVPATLRSVLQARLDALPPAERVAVQRAAVIGRVFWDDAVESIGTGDGRRGDGPDSTGDALDRLRRREVVYQRAKSAFDHNREFRFKHALLRDVAYEGVLRRTRRQYHGRVARWFEQVAARTGRAGQFAVLIADHHAQAGDGESAARWYLTAGRQAAAVNGLADARRLLERGLEHVPPAATAGRCDLLLAREAVLDRLGDRAAQQADLADLESLEPVIAELDPARHVGILLARCRWLFHHTEYDAEAAAAHRAIDVAGRAARPDLEAEARLWLGKGLTWRGDHDRARDALTAALAGGRASGRRKTVAEALRYLAIVANNVSDFPTATALLDEVLALHREAHDDEGESVVAVQLASVLFNEGRYGAAREVLERVMPVVVASGYRYREAVVTTNLAAIVVQQGEFGLGHRLITRGLELCEELDDKEGTATAYTIRGEVERRVGSFAAAQISLRAAIDLSPTGHAVVASDSLLGLALVAIAEGRPDDARGHAQAAVAKGREGGSPMAVARAHVGLGYALLAGGRADEAAEALRAGGDEAGELRLRYLVVEAEAALARVALDRDERPEAQRLAASVLSALGDPDLLGALESGEIHLSCWHVLAECGDPRADAARDAARAYLTESATRIDDDALRDGFLHRVPAHVELARRLAAAPP